MINLLLFPSSYFNKNEVDENLKAEYDAAKSTNLFEIVLFNNAKWFNENKLILSRKTSNELQVAIYRGWMMKPDQYRLFYQSLLKQNIKLINNPDEYELMHIFPNVYRYLEENTAKMEIYPLNSNIDVEDIKSKFDRFIVKDFVKSVKGTNFPRYFDNTVSQEEFDEWMKVFYKYRGSLLTGGICIKEYLDLKKYDQINEYRVFYVNHEIATISRNSNQSILTPLPPQNLIEKYKNLNSSYYTIDFAELENGDWKIIEAGDGEVSGLSDSQNYVEYYETLYKLFNK